MTKPIVFVLGGPGAGKGTQSSKLVQEYNCLHLSAGDLLRAERAREGSEHGELIEYYIKEGLIVPAEITVTLIKNAILAAPEETPVVLIDGFPRAIDQYECFTKIIGLGNFMLFLDVSEDTMLARLTSRAETSGRIDDNVDSIRKRFRVFREQTMPIVNRFREQDRLVSIDAGQDPEAVFEQIKPHITKLLA